MRWAIRLGLFLNFAQVSTVSAAEVNVLSARAMATVLKEIGWKFEQTSGHKLNVISGLPNEFIKHLNAGAPVDLVVSGSAPVDRLVQEGTLVAGTRTDLVRSGIGVGVRVGAPKPDISSVEAAGSGDYLATLLDRLGIAEAIAPKSCDQRPTSS